MNTVLAILFCDIVGFTRKSERFKSNPEKIYKYLNVFVQIAETLLTKINAQIYSFHCKTGKITEQKTIPTGALLKKIGDALMFGFKTCDAAVLFGLLLQKKLKEINKTRTENDKYEIRIGINYGLVYEDNTSDLFGDAVNVASRLETSCKPSGVLISDNVFHHITDKKLKTAFEPLKKKLEIKNHDDIKAFYDKETGPPKIKDSKLENLWSVINNLNINIFKVFFLKLKKLISINIRNTTKPTILGKIIIIAKNSGIVLIVIFISFLVYMDKQNNGNDSIQAAEYKQPYDSLPTDIPLQKHTTSIPPKLSLMKNMAPETIPILSPSHSPAAEMMQEPSPTLQLLTVYIEIEKFGSYGIEYIDTIEIENEVYYKNGVPIKENVNAKDDKVIINFVIDSKSTYSGTIIYYANVCDKDSTPIEFSEADLKKGNIFPVLLGI